MTKSEKDMTSKEEIKLCEKAHDWPSLATLKDLVKNEARCLALPPKEIQELEENDKDKELPKIIVLDSNSHSASTTVSEAIPGDIKNNDNHQLQVKKNE